MNGFDKARQMRREMGRELRERRQSAGMSQAELARRTGRSRSTVSSVESATGKAAALGFWQRCDEVFGTSGTFARAWLQVRREVETERARAAAARQAATAGRATLDVSARLRALAYGGMTTAQAEAVYTDLGWPLVAGRPFPELVTGSVADALEVSRSAGLLAMTWWLDTQGAADVVRGLPALPSPQHALAVISDGAVLHFLIRAGSSPWLEAGTPGPAVSWRNGRHICWHSAGSSVPLPPAGADAGQPAEWLHLPARGLRLASPFAVLDLLAKAIAATSGAPESISLAGGVLAVPCRRSAAG